jgi:hypothetical protein
MSWHGATHNFLSHASSTMHCPGHFKKPFSYNTPIWPTSEVRPPSMQAWLHQPHTLFISPHRR